MHLSTIREVGAFSHFSKRLERIIMVGTPEQLLQMPQVWRREESVDRGVRCWIVIFWISIRSLIICMLLIVLGRSSQMVYPSHQFSSNNNKNSSPRWCSSSCLDNLWNIPGSTTPMELICPCQATVSTMATLYSQPLKIHNSKIPHQPLTRWDRQICLAPGKATSFSKTHSVTSLLKNTPETQWAPAPCKINF